MPRPLSLRLRLFVVAGVALGAYAFASAQAVPPPAAPSAGPAQIDALTVDLTVLDRDGKVPDTLLPGEVTVTLDGKPRRVLWVRRVSRGPGAVADAAARAGRAAGGAASRGMTFAAEPARTVLLIVDTATLVRGEERSAIPVVAAFLDHLGISDRVAVVAIPFARDHELAFSTEQPAARDALNRVAGQAGRAPMRADAFTAPRALADRDRDAVGNPDRERIVEADRPVREDTLARPLGSSPITDEEIEALSGRNSAASLVSAVRTLRQVPGRKVVVLFSVGLARSAFNLLSQAAGEAAAARAVIYTIRLRGDGGDAQDTLDYGALERLAVGTGGSYTALGNKPGSQIERVAAETAGSFVLGIERDPSDGGAKRRSLRVGTVRRDLVVRGPQFLAASRPEDEDVVPQATAAGSASSSSSLSYRAGGEVDVKPATTSPSAKNPDYAVALGRLFDYVDAYVEQASALVAEEDYKQTFDSKKLRTRSDLLLVKPERSLEWVSFRDVFEVDGFPVREREDRLKHLFLEAKPETAAQLEAIKTESARYNIGPVERNINVPHFPLKFLVAANRGRFRYHLKGTPTVDGVKTWRIEYEEAARPTVISDRAGRDVPASGWFLVDQATGAIVETRLTVEDKASIEITFARDPVLGMWVPTQMKETYRIARPSRIAGRPDDGEDVFRGTATYAKLRRFQVKTESVVTIPK